MDQQVQQVAEQAADVAQKAGSTIAISSGLWAWLGNNYHEVSTACGVIALLVAIAGLIFNIRHKRRVERIMERQIARH